MLSEVHSVHQTPSPTVRNNQPLIVLSLLSTWIIWGSTYLAIRFALDSFAPFLLMGLRFVIAGGLLMIVCRLRGAALPAFVEWRNATIVGGLMLGGGMASAAYAEQTVSSGLVVTFIAISPLVMSAMLMAIKIYPTRREILGMALGAMGVGLLSQGQGFSASPSGMIAVLVGCVTWNLGSVLSRFKTPLAPGVMGYASEMVMGGAILLIMSVIHQERWPVAVTPKALGSFIYLIVFGSWVAFNAYMVLLERVRPALALSYTFINPIIGVALGIVLANETFTFLEAVAAFIILIGLIIALTGRR